MVINNQITELTPDEEFKLVDMVAHTMNWPWAMALDQIQLGSEKIMPLVATWLDSHRKGAFIPMHKNFDPTAYQPNTNEKNLYNVQI